MAEHALNQRKPHGPLNSFSTFSGTCENDSQQLHFTAVACDCDWPKLAVSFALRRCKARACQENLRCTFILYGSLCDLGVVLLMFCLMEASMVRCCISRRKTAMCRGYART